MEDVKLEAKVEKVKKVAEDWLLIEVKDVDGLDSKLSIYKHRVGSFGEVTIQGIDKTFVQSLYDKLAHILAQWDKPKETKEKDK